MRVDPGGGGGGVGEGVGGRGEGIRGAGSPRNERIGIGYWIAGDNKCS